MDFFSELANMMAGEPIGGPSCPICGVRSSQKRCTSCGFQLDSIIEPPRKLVQIPKLLGATNKCGVCASKDPQKACNTCERRFCTKCCTEDFHPMFIIVTCKVCAAKEQQMNLDEEAKTQKKINQYHLKQGGSKRKVVYQTLLGIQFPIALVDVIWGYNSEMHDITITVDYLPYSSDLPYVTSTGESFVFKGGRYGFMGIKLTCQQVSERIATFLRCDPDDIRLFHKKRGSKVAEELKFDAIVIDGEGIVLGRPFLNQTNSYSIAKTLEKPNSRDWSSIPLQLESKCSVESKAWLSQQWEKDGFAEHASIGSFSRHLLELLAVGAPSQLISGVQRAIGEEIIHAQLCFSLASFYRGSPVEPGKFPVDSNVTVRTDITSLAVGTAIEGCYEETISAICAYVTYQSYIKLEKNHDPSLTETLKCFAIDEISHAALAWRTLIWACDQGGPNTRKIVQNVFRERFQILSSSSFQEDSEMANIDLLPYGRLSCKLKHQVAILTTKLLIEPWSQLLFQGNCLKNSKFSHMEHPAKETDVDPKVILLAGNEILVCLD